MKEGGEEREEGDEGEVSQAPSSLATHIKQHDSTLGHAVSIAHLLHACMLQRGRHPSHNSPCTQIMLNLCDKRQALVQCISWGNPAGRA